MNTGSLFCPKCDGKMAQGFLTDNSHGEIFISAWFEGKPEKSFWTRTKKPKKPGIPIGAFRCRSCGFLEFYSDNQFTPE
jgi:hypothetical protein